MKSSRGLTRNPLRVYVEYDLINEDGRVVKRGRQLSHSFLIYWIKFIYLMINSCYEYNPPYITAVDTGGTSRTIPAAGSSYFWRVAPAFRAFVGDTYRGLVVGSGSTPNSSGTYKLESLIPHGTSAGQLQYGDSSTTDIQEISTGVFETSYYRPFLNASGGDVVVRECGVYVHMYDKDGVPRYFCALRDLLNPPNGVVVPNNSTLVVRYRFRITIS